MPWFMAWRCLLLPASFLNDVNINLPKNIFKPINVISSPKFIFWGIFAIAIFLTVWSQLEYNQLIKATRKVRSHQIFLPSPALVQDFSFGFRNFLADAFWIQAIQYTISEGLRKNSLMAQYLDIVTTLDPKFEYPYLFSDILLAKYGSIDDARRLSDRGIAAIPQSWQIPFYLAVQYRVVKKDYDQALKYMRIAATKPDKPSFVTKLIATYTLKSGDEVSARELFDAIYKTTDDKFTKDEAGKWIQQIDHIELLQSLIFSYKRIYGVYPKSVDELIAGKLVRQIPQDLANYRFLIDAQTGALKIQ